MSNGNLLPKEHKKFDIKKSSKLNIFQTRTKTKILYKNKNIFHNASFLQKNRLNINLIIVLYIILFLKVSSSEKINFRGLNSDNYITMTIRGKGEQQLINTDNNNIPLPNKIIIINENMEIIDNIEDRVQDLNSEQNEIKLIWDNDLTSCKNMFKGLTNITNLDLTGFSFSQVNNMESFFQGCSALESINLSNANAENVINMNYMFKDCISLVSINFTNFKTNKLEQLEETFRGCKDITSIDLTSFETPNLLKVSNAFYLCTSLKYINFGNFDTSKVIAMNGMFSNCKSIESLNLSNFNTDSVKYMYQMFDQCNSLTSIDLSNFYTPSLISFNKMFNACHKLEYIDISNFNTTSVSDMGQVFDQCYSIKSLNLSHFNTSLVTNIWHMFWSCQKLEFLDISQFNTNKISNMENLFHDCRSLKSLDLSSFNTSLVQKMNGMFLGCSNLEIVNLTSFNTEYVTSMDQMFRGCSSLKSLDLSNFFTPKLESMKEIFTDCKSLEILDISNFNTSKITDMAYLFSSCENLKFINIQNFDTTSVTNMEYMFRNCMMLEVLNISNFNTKSVINMNRMFDQCKLLISLDISNFYTPLVENIDNMFYNCYSLTSLDISNLNTSKIKNMNCLFYNCTQLSFLNLSNFDTTSVKNMASMFYGCKKLEFLDLSNFYTPSLVDINQIFAYCGSLKWVNISNFDTSKVTDISGLFARCASLTSIDLKNFETNSVIRMHYLFDNCKSLTSVNISHFDTSKVVTLGHMFDQCIALTSLDLSNFNTTLVTNIDNMFYNCRSLEYLDISSFNTEKITNMGTLFNSCINLKSLNLSSFTIYDSTIVNSIFGYITNIILCYNESKMPSHFLDVVNRYENSCLKLCIINSKKYILEIEMCVNDCFKEDIYKYEYQNICYSECPIRTQVSSNSTYLCQACTNYYNYEYKRCSDEIPEGYYLNDSLGKIIYKCPIKCKDCSLESINDNLCITCNNNYYPKINDSLSKDPFYECYYQDEEQIGYYLNEEENIFKPCYYKCKSCFGEGNEDNNNCIEYKNDYIGNCNKVIIKSSNIINSDIFIYSSVIFTEKIINITWKNNYKYLYDITSDSEEKNNTNHTYIELDQETIEFLKDKFSLTDEEHIYISINEEIKNDSYTAIVDYSYDFILENSTKLNLTSIEEDIYIDVYVPIDDLELAKFDLNIHFAEQGYDIYDINSKFYNDLCAPANLDGNDITLSDRRKDIYPNNITLCKSNCKYSGVNIEEKRIICSCSLNPDKKIDEDEFDEQDDDDFAAYLLDNINYKIFKCYSLFFDFENLKKSYPFYIILIIFVILQIMNFIYICYSLKKFKIYLSIEVPSIKTKMKEKFLDIRRINCTYTNNINKEDNPPKKILLKNNKNLRPGKYRNKSEKNVFIYVTDKDNKDNVIKNSKPSKKILANCITITNKNNYKNNELINGAKINIKRADSKIEKLKEENINELPYSKAIRVDKRNIFQIFYSFIIEKLELISILCSKNHLKLILYLEYILALLINFFFNSLLYSDDVVSNKYHNNGKLDFIVTLTLSILSNIVTSIFFYFIKYSRGLEKKINLILERRYKIRYYRNIIKFMRHLEIKFICFYISQFLILSICMYYIVIFCILYSGSQRSLIINYCYSLVESIITSFAISFIILLTRKIGLSCQNKVSYNISKYINSKF